MSVEPRYGQAETRVSLLDEDLEDLHPASFGWALACCGWDAVEAEDVLQEAYVKVLDGAAVYEGRSTLRTWLFGVIRRTAAARRRTRWLRALALGRWLATRPDPRAPRDPESLAGESEAVRALREALDGLARRQRDLLHLVFYQDLTLEEASRVLGISAGSARTHYHRGKKRLRERLRAGGRP